MTKASAKQRLSALHQQAVGRGLVPRRPSNGGRVPPLRQPRRDKPATYGCIAWPSRYLVKQH